MRALTLIQPWAWAICHASKRIENREWKPPAWLIGTRLAIHAGKKRDDEGLYVMTGLVPPDEIPLGAIVATARLVGVVEDSEDEWFCGPFGWVLRDVDVLTEPIACRGAQGLWIPPPDILSAITRAASVRAPTPDPSPTKGASSDAE